MDKEKKSVLENYSGRQWVKSTKDDFNNLPENIEIVPAMEKIEGKYCCTRCDTVSQTCLPGDIFYCRECIGLGRICQMDILCRMKSTDEFKVKENFLTWNGELTEGQNEISHALQNSFIRRKNHLVHAVTGAGKTEMLFEVINLALTKGARVCIATPRIDVVNELHPRISAAFTTISVGKYHGKEYFEPKNDQLTICTTHQLLKFYHAFDLVIIDEVDAFPFRDNRVLHFGAKNAVKKSGCCFYLTATPSSEQLAEVKQGVLEYSLLKRRFHGFDLPVPKLKLFISPTVWKNKILNPYLEILFRKNLHLKKPIMIFVPKIKELPIYLAIFQKKFPDTNFETVHAGDAERLEKVKKFREGQIDVLLTTTILERGVTIKHVQVFILDADDRIYNTAALVQIAGRVGRAKDDPNGNVYFCYHQYTTEIDRAVKQIKEMNHG